MNLSREKPALYFLIALPSVLALLIIIFYSRLKYFEMEEQVVLEDGKTAYLALSDGVEFIIISESNRILDAIKIHLDNEEGEYGRSGNWQDDGGLDWDIKYSVEGKNSLVVNGRTFYLSAGRVFVFRSDGNVIQLDDSGFEWGKDIDANQIQDFVEGGRKGARPHK